MTVLQFAILGSALFCLGIYGVLTRRNAVMVLLSVELMLAAVNINLVAFNAFFLGMVNLCNSSRNFYSGAPVNNSRFFRPQTQGRSGGIHGHVTGTQGDYVFTPDDRRVILGKTIGFHEIGSRQVFIGGINTDQIFSGHIQESWQPCANTHKDSFISFLKELIDGNGSADHLIALHFNT